MPEFQEWSERDAAHHIRVPLASDDKYSRGVLGVKTGSKRYPGAAVLGVEAALRTGVGMVRYLGPNTVADLVLQRRPEAVLGRGRVQAWLLGSGIDRDELGGELLSIARGEDDAEAQQRPPVILDGGALELHSIARGPVVITPHCGELAGMFSRIVGSRPTAQPTAKQIALEPQLWAIRATEQWGVTVLLKGHTTVVAGPGVALVASSATPWLATAGTGDALGGILGALVATHSDAIAADPRELARVAGSAAVLHGCAARHASAGGPFTVLDLCAAIPATVADLQRRFGGTGEPLESDYS